MYNKEFEDYIAENLTSFINYAEYIAENLSSIKYAEYIAENLDNTLDNKKYMRKIRIEKLNKLNKLYDR